MPGGGGRVRRVGIFIDGPNLYHCARRSGGGGGHLDIPAFVRWLAGDRELTEAVYWTALLQPEVDRDRATAQARFFAVLERSIPNARVGRATQRRVRDRWVEKGVDVGLALDVVLGAIKDRWDDCVIVSGDGDLRRAGLEARALGKRVEVASSASRLSPLLRAAADLVVLLDDELHRFARR